MFSGYLMAALSSIDGRHGLKGWQWLVAFRGVFLSPGLLISKDRLFILDGVISLPIAFAGFFLYPDSPSNTRVFYLNENVSKRDTVQAPAILT
jgi:ACS family pantothenate transporter-like MFS transporter